MIARHAATGEKSDIWAQLAAPLPDGVIQWRQDGRPAQRDGKYFARFVAYIDAHFVRERLDMVVPGEWDLTLEQLPTPAHFVDADGEAEVAFKARLAILGVIREDVGQGRDYKTAATDAFKRAAVRFGVGAELYAYEQNWVQVDGDGKFAKPVEDPTDAYARRLARNGNGTTAPRPDVTREAPEPTPGPYNQTAPQAADEPSCPKCGGRLWDNRLSKRNPKAPDGKCRSRSCDGVRWKWGEENGTKGNATTAPADDDYDPERGF